jgi:hypothetical protein
MHDATTPDDEAAPLPNHYEGTIAEIFREAMLAADSKGERAALNEAFHSAAGRLQTEPNLLLTNFNSLKNILTGGPTPDIRADAAQLLGILATQAPNYRQDIKAELLRAFHDDSDNVVKQVISSVLFDIRAARCRNLSELTAKL